MTVRVYRSTDAGSPGTLNLNNGSLITILDACLVNGYGALSGAGWTIAYTANANQKVYRQGGGNMRYMNVNDTGGNVAIIVGYETMTAYGTGTGPFPSAGQNSGNAYLHKATSSGCPWVIVATNKMFYLWVNAAAASSPGDGATANMYAFGDIKSYKSTADGYETISIMNSGVNSTAQIMQGAGSQLTSNPSVSSYMCRSYTGTGGSIGVGKFSDYVKTTNSGVFGYSTNSNSLPAFPDPATNGAIVCPVWVNEVGSGVCRGAMPGMWMIGGFSNYQFQNMRFPAMGVQLAFTSGPMNGKTLESFTCYNGFLMLEVSDTW